MSPLDLLYSWQALMVAIVATGITQLLKTILDVTLGKAAPESTPGIKEMAKVGMDKRKSNVVVNRFVLPMAPILVGFIYAMLVPIRPEALIEYVTAHVPEVWQQYLVFGSWGAACGQFADYGFSKVKSALGDLRSRS